MVQLPHQSTRSYYSFSSFNCRLSLWSKLQTNLSFEICFVFVGLIFQRVLTRVVTQDHNFCLSWGSKKSCFMYTISKECFKGKPIIRNLGMKMKWNHRVVTSFYVIIIQNLVIHVATWNPIRLAVVCSFTLKQMYNVSASLIKIQKTYPHVNRNKLTGAGCAVWKLNFCWELRCIAKAHQELHITLLHYFSSNQFLALKTQNVLNVQSFFWAAPRTPLASKRH